MVKSSISRITGYVGGPETVIIIGVITSASSALLPSSIIDYFGGPEIVILMGSLIITIGAVLTSKRQTKSESELRAKSDEIAELNRRIVASVTGGDSFCYISLQLGDGATNTPDILVVHEGQYPLYDVQIRIVDLDKMEQIKNRDKLTLREIMEQTEDRLEIGNLSLGQARFMSAINLPEADIKRFNFFITARNGFVTQLIRLRRINALWKSATKVTREHEGEEQVLLEKVDPEFPRDESGQVQW